MTKLKLTLTVDYEVNPEHYGMKDITPREMAIIDEEQPDIVHNIIEMYPDNINLKIEAV